MMRWLNQVTIAKLKEFFILGEARKRVSRTATLDFQRADFDLFRGLIEGVP